MWKSFQNKIHLEETHPYHSWRPQRSQMWILWKSFSAARDLKKHIYTIHGGHKDHKCESCGKCFSEAGTLKKHINSLHNGQKDHKCNSCGKSFSQAGSLKTH